MKWPVRITSIIRWLIMGAVTILLVVVCSYHHHGGMKGSYIPISNIVTCMATASFAAILCKLYWRSFLVPAVAGVAGALGIGGHLYEPYGCVVGILVGLLVAFLPISLSARQRPAQN
jgi:hypothetical protein